MDQLDRILNEQVYQNALKKRNQSLLSIDHPENSTSARADGNNLVHRLFRIPANWKLRKYPKERIQSMHSI